MRQTIFSLVALLTLTLCDAIAEDGSRLWLRYSLLQTADVRGEQCVAASVLRDYYPGPQVTLALDATMADDDGFLITGTAAHRRVSAHSQVGLLYGAFALLRGETGASAPAFKYRILNHWDNLDSSIERGYAGTSIFWDGAMDIRNEGLLKQYALANASIGINGTVLNNVNASPKILTAAYLRKVKDIADLLRPYGLKVFLSVNFGSPKALGEVKTADPLNRQVQRWWQRKVREIYRLIPDFGGFLVKANSEGQPGPFDYGRTHADGANMLADALLPYGGIVMWRSFVYGAKHKGEDRVKQAVSEFAELDGQFRHNVILQSKNGPLDFQPREPYAPIFDQMKQTAQMAELQITQEYLGQGDHLVFLAPMWKEFFSFVSPKKLVGVAGVSNIGNDRNWCGHHFAQANWYAFGRLAWNPLLSSRQIAEEWVSQTFGPLSPGVSGVSGASGISGASAVSGISAVSGVSGISGASGISAVSLVNMMLRSREACVDYMMPLGLHHIFKFDHHMGPEPDGFKPEYPIEWCPVYYHKADKAGVGFDRSTRGSGATRQYREPYASLYDQAATCPEQYLLWFHHLPWTYRTRSGRTLWEELQYRYDRGVAEVEGFVQIWQQAQPLVDDQRWQEVKGKLDKQLRDAREWQQVCTGYFGSFARTTATSKQ